MKKVLFITFLSLYAGYSWSQCGANQISLTMVIHTDGWPYETYWQLVPEGAGCGNQVIAEGSNLNVGCASTASNNSPEGYAGDAIVNVGPICLDSGSYDLIFIDTYGDGGLIFELYENGNLMHAYTGAGFGSTFTFSTGVTAIPAYDAPCQAIPIMPNGPSVSVNNINATGSLGEPTPNGNDCGAYGSWCETGISNSVWMTFVPTVGETYEITSCHPETNTDTQMALWRTQNCQDFSTYELVSSNDDMLGGCNSGGNVYASQLFAGCLDTSYQYFLQIDGWSGSVGDIEVSIASFTAAPQLQALVHNITCPLNKGETGDGFIQPYIIGSGIDFSCEWTGPNGFTSSAWLPQNLEAGLYSLTATTTCGSILSGQYTIEMPEWWSVMANVTQPSCPEATDGGIAPTVTGGTPDYGFQWVGPNGYTSIANEVIDLSAGVYQMTITDANGCTYNNQYTIEGGNNFTFELGPDIEMCLNDAVTVSGPIGASYIYYWQDGTATADYVISAAQWGLGTHQLTLNVVTTSGCYFSDQLNFIVNDCVGVEEIGNKKTFFIFPNPADEASFNIPSSMTAWSQIKVQDLSGRVIFISNVNDGNHINLPQDLANGSYLVELFDKKNELILHSYWILNQN